MSQRMSASWRRDSHKMVSGKPWRGSFASGRHLMPGHGHLQVAGHHPISWWRSSGAIMVWDVRLIGAINVPRERTACADRLAIFPHFGDKCAGPARFFRDGPGCHLFVQCVQGGQPHVA